MNRASLLITLLMGALTVLLWAVVNRPDIEPPWPAKIEGFSFSPMRGEQSPVRREYQTNRDLRTCQPGGCKIPVIHKCRSVVV